MTFHYRVTGFYTKLNIAVIITWFPVFCLYLESKSVFTGNPIQIWTTAIRRGSIKTVLENNPNLTRRHGLYKVSTKRYHCRCFQENIAKQKHLLNFSKPNNWWKLYVYNYYTDIHIYIYIYIYKERQYFMNESFPR